MEENLKNRVGIKIGDIGFEVEGSTEVVERERAIFLSTILPAAVDAIVQIRGAVPTVQYIEPAKQDSVFLSSKNSNTPNVTLAADSAPVDLARTNLSAYIKDLGVLSDQDFTLIAAYFDEIKNDVKSFNVDSVKQYYADARRGKSSNYSDLLQKLAQKGHIMDDPDSEKKTPKSYILTDKGLDYAKNYRPKEGGSEKPKTTKKRKTSSKVVSIYSNLSADDLNLKNYPVIKSQDTFKKQMILTLYIVTVEGKGESFSVADVQCLLTDKLGLHATIDQINGVFKEKSWFKSEIDPNNKKAHTRKLLQGAKDFAESIINGTAK
jgi:hypothetical protein